MNKLKGKVAVITGAAQGMGETHSRLFIDEGAKVILTDIDELRGKAIADELGENAIFIRHDVTKPGDWQTVLAEGEKKFGHITVLVNNVGINGPVSATTQFSNEDYEKVCTINQTSVFLGMKTIIPSMLKAGYGSIINISSIAGLVSIYGSPNLAYVGSKFAVRGMTKFAAIEHAKNNIRVNSVHPGITMTKMVSEALGENTGDALSLIPLGKFAKPIEVSRLVLFLASDDSSYITGSEQVIDGGMTAM